MIYTTKSGMEIDESRIGLYRVFRKVFNPIYFKEYLELNEALSRKILKPDSCVFASEINGRYIVIDSNQMHLHHTVQGQFENQNWMFGFCGICNSGACFDTTMDGKELVFYTAGVYNGFAVWSDDQTNSLWDHNSGECFKGEYAGRQLSFLSNLMEYQIGDLLLLGKGIYVLSKRKSKLEKLFSDVKFFVIGIFVRLQQRVGVLPPVFYKTLGKADERLHKYTMGVCVENGTNARFYPKNIIEKQKKIVDTFDGKTLLVSIHENSKIPFAKFEDGSKPKQNFMRWYGASYSFPKISIYDETEN